MTTNITVTAQEVQRRLNTILTLVAHPKKLMGAIAATLHEETNKNFATKGHGTWPALKHRDGEPLRDTSDLYNAITQRSTNTTAELGVIKDQARMQHYGAKQGQFGKTKRNTPIPWGDVPARRYFPIDDNGRILPSALERVMEVLETAVQNALK